MAARQLAIQPTKRYSAAHAEIERTQRQRLRENLPEYFNKQRWSSGSQGGDLKVRFYKGRMYVLEHAIEENKKQAAMEKEKKSSLGFVDFLFILSAMFFTCVVVFIASRFWFLSDILY